MNTADSSISKSKRALRLLLESFSYPIVLVPITILIVFLLTRSVSKDTFVLLMFLEGGLGLLAGVGISLSNSPSVAKTSEQLFRTSPWSREAEKHAQRAGLRWIIASTFLVIIGFLVSRI